MSHSPTMGHAVPVLAGDTWVHLAATAGAGSTLCGLAISPEVPRQWLALAGCKGCAAYALAHGLDHATDIDGSEVPLVRILDLP
jgi:hypothetical protein